MSKPLLQDLGFKPVLIKALERKAQRLGQSAAEYLRLLAERDVLADKPFDEMLKIIRADFKRSGITEGELGQLVKRARNSTKKPRGSSK